LEDNLTDPKQNRELPAQLENFARSLLATTCLTVVCGAGAVAGTITETPSNLSYFPTSFPSVPDPFPLPLGTTVVNGVVGEMPGELGVANQSYFEFQGLTPGGSYTLTGVSEAGDAIALSFFNDIGTQLGTPLPQNPTYFANLDLGENGGNPATTPVFSAPSDGNLVVELYSFKEDGGFPYTVTLATTNVEGGGSTVPEPSTIGGVGFGLGTLALAWRRRQAH
jgi:hypothetical protein